MIRMFLLVFFFMFAAVAAGAQDPGWIGVRIEDQRDAGALIRSIERNSPAEKAGLREGDVIVEFNKERVIGVQQLTRMVRETPVGRTVDIGVRRDNREQNFQITVERTTPDLIRDGLLRDFPRVQISPKLQVLIDRSATLSGIRVEQLTDQLRDFFGVYSNAGVLVSSVDRGSAAEKSGLKAGDVIIEIDGRSVRTPAEFTREMRAGSSKVVLKIVRDKQEQEIAMD